MNKSTISLVVLIMFSTNVVHASCNKVMNLISAGDIRIVASLKIPYMKKGYSDAYLKKIHPQMEAKARNPAFVEKVNFALYTDTVAGVRNSITILMPYEEFYLLRVKALKIKGKYNACMKAQRRTTPSLSMLQQ